MNVIGAMTFESPKIFKGTPPSALNSTSFIVLIDVIRPISS